MTTIAFDGKTLAADSRATTQSDEGGTRVSTCQKLFRKTVSDQPVIIATAGETFSGLVFVEWYGTGKDRPELLVHGEADFDCLVLTREGLFQYDKWCIPDKVMDRQWAIGSGCKAALGAMMAGKTAKRAVEIACQIDPYAAPPVYTMQLPKLKLPRPKKLKGLVKVASPQQMESLTATLDKKKNNASND